MIQLLFTLVLSSTAYLPIVSLPLSQPDHVRACLAWSKSHYAEAIPVPCYYNGNTHTQAEIDKGGMPIVWCNREDTLSKIPLTYHGDGLGMNEPGGPDQCGISVDDTVEAVHRLETERPDINWYAPNIIRPWYMDLYLEAYLKEYLHLPRAIPGIHFYAPLIGMGIGPEQPTKRINEFCGILESHGLPCRVAVTEYGICDWQDRNGQITYAWTRAIMTHPAVEWLAIYTAYGGSEWFLCSTDLFHADGTLTPIGHGFRAARHGWAWRESNRR